MLLLYHSHKHISYPIRTIARSAILLMLLHKLLKRKLHQTTIVKCSLISHKFQQGQKGQLQWRRKSKNR
ncbi:hypothetical protein OZD68_02430 [Wolbachia endosymbiont of Drosophila bicornuta]|uniref:hypothetical protein n=1 Tax=Wolbachia TaxID=953 RepID=UPI002174DD6B|nr:MULTISPECIES: hypothetical protein [Wolbachia]MDE5056449.1 hypothetical protein [Wolbachia endosymbiont of Drosophila bicornuta]